MQFLCLCLCFVLWNFFLAGYMETDMPTLYVAGSVTAKKKRTITCIEVLCLQLLRKTRHVVNTYTCVTMYSMGLRARRVDIVGT